MIQTKIILFYEVTMQVNKLYVGNLSYSVTNSQLEELFGNYGQVKEIKIIDGKGFGFVEMSTSEEAEKAKEALNGSDFEGRTLRIDEARPPKPRNDRDRRY
jgi:RNA recognition motif-containing protein